MNFEEIGVVDILLVLGAFPLITVVTLIVFDKLLQALAY